MRVSRYVLIVALLGGQLCAVNGDTSTVDQRSEEAGNNQTLIVTVFGKPLYLEQVTPASVEVKRGELARGEYDEWLRKYRGRRIYEILWRNALQRYVEREKISVTEVELAAIAKSVERRLKSAPEAPRGT